MSRTSLHNHTAGVNPSPGLDVNLPTYHRPPAGAIIAGALDALARGAYLLPVNPADKTPMVASAQAYLDGRRNLTAGDVERYAGRGALFAVALGPTSLVVGDLDAPDLDGAGPLASHFAGPHVSPTRSGGRHAWFTRPRDVPAKRRIKPVPGAAVDVLAGGYAILWAGFLPPAAELPPDIARILTDPPPHTPMPLPADLPALPPAAAAYLTRPPDDPAPGGAPSPGPRPAGPDVDLTGDDRERYVRAALAGECAAVEATAEGARNSRLTVGAFRVGRVLHLAPHLRGEAEAALELAALATGLSEREARGCVRAALARGEACPRMPAERAVAGPRHADAPSPATAAATAWAAWADALVCRNVRNGAARERNRRLVEAITSRARADGTIARGTRLLGQDAGLSPASAGRGMVDLVALGALDLDTPAAWDTDAGRWHASVYRLGDPFGGSETSPVGASAQPSVSLPPKASEPTPTALRVGLGKRGADCPAYLSSRARTYAALRAVGAAPVDVLAEAAGVSPRTAREHLSRFEDEGIAEERGTESTGGRPRAVWALASGAAAAIARVTEWGRATLRARWRRIVREWEALRAWAGRVPARGAQAVGARVDAWGRSVGAVVTVTPAVLP